MSARAEEIKFTQSRNVARTGKGPIGGGRAGHDKGHSDAPNARSRPVAKDVAFYKDDSYSQPLHPLKP
eukprot:2907625-Alexandrium_andersonii.AAC.1